MITHGSLPSLRLPARPQALSAHLRLLIAFLGGAGSPAVAGPLVGGAIAPVKALLEACLQKLGALQGLLTGAPPDLANLLAGGLAPGGVSDFVGLVGKAITAITSVLGPL